MNMIEDILQLNRKRVVQRYWLISDLQQSEPAVAKYCMDTAMADFHQLNMEVNGVCYLGDATQGADRTALDTMISMQLKHFTTISAPVYYTSGNHELDPLRAALQNGEKPELYFYEKIRDLNQWHTVRKQTDFYFCEDVGDFVMFFFPDHAAPDGSWYTTHGTVQPNADSYPHSKEDYEKVRQMMADAGKPVFIFSHYAFPGGNREAELLRQLFPLPSNVRAHFSGHAHIGDAYWAGQNLYRKMACIDDHPIMQFDIASLDCVRGSTVRSAFFEYYGHGEYGVFFRDHIGQLWEDCYVGSLSPARRETADR